MSELPIAGDFPRPTKEEWLALVTKALKGRNVDATLTTTTYDDIAIRPIYTSTDTENLLDPIPDASPFTRGFSEPPPNGTWDIRPRHAAKVPSDVNTAILEDIAGGASSFILQMSAPGQFGLEPSKDAIAAALKGVHLDMIAVSLDAGEDYLGAAQSLLTIWDERKIGATSRRGAFNADPLGTLARVGTTERPIYEMLQTMARYVSANLGQWPNVTLMQATSKPYHEAGASEAEELAAMVATLVAYLRALEDEGVQPQKVLPAIELALVCDADLFLSIAKLRAARRMISQIARACGATSAARALRLSSETSERMMARCDPYVNLLRATVACAAAVFGGANIITVLPFSWPLGQADSFARRIARNTQVILAEESFLGQVVDPAGGSWYVEQLSEELAQKAWSLFQTIETKGGMEEALKSGYFQDRIAATAEKRTRDGAHLRKELIGVSAFPHLGELALDVKRHPQSGALRHGGDVVQRLKPWREAAPFEALRNAADVTAKETGNRPSVFMATLGKPADFTARLNYAQNFFAIGGIDTILGEGGNDVATIAQAFLAADREVACLCSSDDIYGALGVDAAKAIKEAGAQQLVLAGYGGTSEADWRSAGIDTFIYVGCDTLTTLREIHAALDIKVY